MSYKFYVLSAFILIIFSRCSVDEEELEKAITEAFSPILELPNGGTGIGFSLDRIYEIRRNNMANTGIATRFLYDADNGFDLGALNIKFIYNVMECDSSLVMINWEDNIIKAAYIGDAVDDLDDITIENLEQFKQGSDKWIFEYDDFGNVVNVFLENNPESQRLIYYNPVSDFLDSIKDFKNGNIYRTFKYQYEANRYDLMGILELDQASDTIATYTFEIIDNSEPSPPPLDLDNPFQRSKLFALPITGCNYLNLYGSLWRWHFPYILKRLYRNGDLVYESTITYDQSFNPTRVDYQRTDSLMGFIQYSELIEFETIDSP